MSDCHIIKGPCRITGHAVSNLVIETKGDVVITKKRDAFDVGTDQAGVLDKRLKSVVHEISFTPSGTIAVAEGILEPYMNKGQGTKVLINDSSPFTVIATNSGGTRSNFTHDGTAVYYAGQMVKVASGTAHYVGTFEVVQVIDSTHVVLAISFTATATGTITVPPCLVIHPLIDQGDDIVVYQNCGVTKLPDLNLASTETLLGEMTLSALYHPYLDSSDAGLVNRLTWAAPAGAMASYTDGSDIVTAPPRCRYGAFSTDAFTGADPLAAPWNDFCTLNGAKLAWNLTLNADETDCCGIVNWTYAGVSCQATLTPVGSLMTDEAIDIILEEGPDAVALTLGLVRGQSLQRTQRELLFLLEWEASAWMVSLRNAVVTGGKNAFGANAPRTGELTFAAVRRVSTGALQPLATFSI